MTDETPVVALSHEERIELIKQRAQAHEDARRATMPSRKNTTLKPIREARPRALNPESISSLCLKVAQAFQGDFTVEDLAVACWKERPDKFGMPGYRDVYPSNNVVASLVFGKRGLVAKKALLREKTNGVSRYRAATPGSRQAGQS